MHEKTEFYLVRKFTFRAENGDIISLGDIITRPDKISFCQLLFTVKRILTFSCMILKNAQTYVFLKYV